MIVELPCGILKDGKVYDWVNIDEIRGKQQNYLSNMDLIVDNFGHIPKLIADLATDYQTKEGLPAGVKPEEALWTLPTEDIEVILIKIREFTFGSTFAMPTACYHCGKQQLKKVELASLEIKGIADKKVRTKVVTLPKSNTEVEVKLLYLKDLFEMYKIMREQKTSLFTSTTILSVARLGDKTVLTPEDLDNVPISDLRLIEQAYLNLRGLVDLSIINVCDVCKKEYELPLAVMDPLFFAQSQTLTM